MFSGLFLLVAACVDSFDTPKISFEKGLLVVEGFINSGGGPTTIRLTHTIELANEKGNPIPELKATVTVEGDDNSRYPIAEKNNGTYSATISIINPGKKYRIHIRTTTGKEYVSDFVSVRQSPPIDSVTWIADREKNVIQFYVNTHDPENKTTYYQWEYVETWQYRADCINPLDPIPKYACWSSQGSTSIFNASSSRLSSDVISGFPLGFIHANSEKPNIVYSLLVKQYALSRAEFDYLDQMKKNTEKLGSIFDPQPSQLQGNIRSVSDPEEPVLGFVSVHSVAEQRIFLLNYKLPGWIYKIPSWYVCPPPESGPCDPSPPCADCTRRGGTNIKPDFWIN